jgi:hypothetical protein
MRRMRSFFGSTATRLRQRGSALLASLMVIVGLSLLGLGFVAISETESAISINQRNRSQTVAVAEAGARLVVQWFQSPDKMLDLELMPVNDDVFKTQRVIPGYTGFYKADVDEELLFDIPYGPRDNDRFYGAEDSPDILIDRTTDEGVAFLNALNTRFLGEEGAVDARPAGEITEIRVFAPPMVGATLTAANPPHFYAGGTRYGVATIMVRAERFDRPLSSGDRRSIARAESRIVISQFPMPVPAGPLQSASPLETNGNFHVNWGLVSSQSTLDLKKDYGSLPWFNAYERIHFNRGYDSSLEWAPNTVFNTGEVVRPRAATLVTTPALRAHEYTVITGGTTGPNEPAWQTVAGAEFTGPGSVVRYKQRTPTAYPIASGGSAGQTNRAWLHYIARGDLSYQDPWFHARAVSNVIGEPNNNAQPFPFNFANPGSTGASHHFQFQSFDSYPNFKQLLFPIISYDFWKAAALAGNGEEGDEHVVKYLRNTGGMNYTDGVTTKSFRDWAGWKPGFYFFDTANEQNPQNGGPGTLSPDVTINGGGAYMGSFIYLNANFATTGLAGPNGRFNQPGEPYMDIGYRQVALAAGGGVSAGDFVRDAAGMPVITGAVNQQWDYQDLPWSNSGGVGPGGTKNERFDVFVAARPARDPGNGGAVYTGWFPAPYVPGCKPGNNACNTCDCSEPHEPYLNLQYSGATLGLTVGWFNPTSPVTSMRLPKKTVDGERTGMPVTCAATSSTDDCTSNGYDLDGALVQMAPATDGILYVEGDFTSKGNADYYGSVLVGGEVDAKGTPHLWYDESLSRGTRRGGFPRVMVTSIETDR